MSEAARSADCRDEDPQQPGPAMGSPSSTLCTIPLSSMIAAAWASLPTSKACDHGRLSTMLTASCGTWIIAVHAAASRTPETVPAF